MPRETTWHLDGANPRSRPELDAGLRAAIHFDDLQWERRYNPWVAYAQSKLATLMFAFELQRRSDAHGWRLMSNACHPGYAVTGSQTAGLRLGRSLPSISELVGKN